MIFDRRTGRLLALASLFLVLSRPPIAAAQEAGGWEIAVAPVRGSVHLITATNAEAQVNLVASIGPDGILLSDTGVDDYAATLRSALTDASAGTLHVRRIVNTHSHGDHTGGNGAFGGDAIIAAHTATVVSLAEGGPFGPGPLEPHAIPTLVVQDSITLRFNDEDIRIFHVPRAHTDGDLAVHFLGADVLHVGDIVLEEGSLPYTRFPRAFADAIDSLVARTGPTTIVVPGHGDPLGRSALLRLGEIVRETVAYVDGARASGSALDEVLDGRPPAWDEWNSRYLSVDDWLTGLFEREGG